MTGALADQAARDRIATALDETLFVEAGAGSGKTKSLVDRIVALIDAGTEMRHIAAITFTEKAAAELRDRIRLSFEARAADAALDDGARARCRTAVEQVDAAAISTLHAFAQRILSENPLEAALPPAVDVLDEVASEIEFTDRWDRFRDALLDDPDLRRTLLLAFAAGITLADLRHLAAEFGANWDLVCDADRVPWGREEPPPVDLTDLLGRGEALLARRSECADGADKLCMHLTDLIEPHLRALRDAPDEYEALRLLIAEQPKYACSYGKRENWADKASVAGELADLGSVRHGIAKAVAEACLHRLAVEVAGFTRAAAVQRRSGGRLEFHDLLVLARDLLRGPHGVAVRRRLSARYRRLLLDEFQDTDPIQIDLAVLIASDDPGAASKAWPDVAVPAGRLFLVGDPKQSIYRFRRADIDLFLRARDRFGPAVALTTNFRATAPVIDWVNHVFGRLISHRPGAQPDYQPLDAAPARRTPAGPPVAVLGRRAHPDVKLLADELREREATDVAEAVLAARCWEVTARDPDGASGRRDATLGDITILLPARTSLAALERALDLRGIPYRAETSSLVYSTMQVRDLMAAARALADPSDQLALVTALRSPIFGCGDDDLFTYRVDHGGAWSFTSPTPEGVDRDHPVAAALAYLRALHAQLPWLAPSELLDRMIRDRKLFELGYAEGRPRDLWRRLRFVLDQARAWSESEGGTLREYLEWARMQASESARVAETILPETDDDSVRIMTIHGAKGLEFPITIVSGMTTTSRGAKGRVQVAFPPQGPVGIKVSAVVTPEFEAFKPIDEQMGYHERLRLLYVACTRAQDHLVVSLHRKARTLPPKEHNRTNAELLALACEGLELHEIADDDAAAPPAAAGRTDAAPLPDWAAWEAERTAALTASARRRSVGASDVELTAPAAALDDDTAAGADKDARDLELPPWQKGRYGTAIGRAVHAVLQTVDLASGEGLPEAAAAQAAAEGVIGRESEIRRLAGAALQAPSVRQALTCARWRETYVATPVGGRILEGYIDLLYRSPAGLVVVDYKTASTAADLDRRMDAYRAQGGAYAVAVEGAAGEPVARVVFVFLTAGGAVERDLPDLPAAKEAVRAAMATAV